MCVYKLHSSKSKIISLIELSAHEVTECMVITYNLKSVHNNVSSEISVNYDDKILCRYKILLDII